MTYLTFRCVKTENLKIFILLTWHFYITNYISHSKRVKGAHFKTLTSPEFELVFSCFDRTLTCVVMYLNFLVV